MATGPTIRYVTVTPTVLNNDAYDAGDTLFDVTAIPLASNILGEPCILDSIVIIDTDDQTAANMTLYFFSSNITTFGTKDSAPSISDADARSSCGYYTMASAAFLDVGGAKIACADNLNKIVLPASGSQTLYVAATTAGTPTQTTGGITLRFGFRDNVG